MKKPIIHLQKSIWILLTLWVALWLSWQALTQLNFGYALWYQVGGIQENIEQYAPLNKYKANFAQTNDAERIALFGGIVSAIQNKGAGLDALAYTTDAGTTTLLHQAEIIHLQDVANLVTILNISGWLGLLAWMGLSMGLKKQTIAFPSHRHTGLVIFGLVLSLIAVILIWGAEQVFYQLHIWIFPADHQWFFYYDESLMSTLMKAPHLFAYIGASLLILWIGLFTGIIQVFQSVKSRS